MCLLDDNAATAATTATPKMSSTTMVFTEQKKLKYYRETLADRSTSLNSSVNQLTLTTD